MKIILMNPSNKTRVQFFLRLNFTLMTILINLRVMRNIAYLLLSITLFSLTNGQLDESIACISEYIQSFRPKMSTKLFEMFKKSYPNTLSTTIKNFKKQHSAQQTYIITGDIEAMWLRDSTNQFLPYMRIEKDCPHIRSLAKGLLNTQAQLIKLDPYTNAFKKFQQTTAQRHFYLNDQTTTLILGIPVDLCRNREFATPSIWERKYEIDSLSSFLRLAYQYKQKYHSLDIINLDFFKTLRRILSLLQQQNKDVYYEKDNKRKFYTFKRDQRQLHNGEIKPSYTTGLIKTGFRPSDDANDHPYNIPGNAMLSTYLNLVAKTILDEVSISSVFGRQSRVLSQQMKKISKRIRNAIFQYGVVDDLGKKIFAYQIDGKGQKVLFDDANLPSLISLPYLKFVEEDDQIYRQTRRWILSEKNPYYYKNDRFRGLGSSHTPPRNIWPLALLTQILTSNDDNEIKLCLDGLIAQANDDLIHESFSIDNPASITRTWFAWANSLFGQAILKIEKEKPHLLQ